MRGASYIQHLCSPTSPVTNSFFSPRVELVQLYCNSMLFSSIVSFGNSASRYRTNLFLRALNSLPPLTLSLAHAFSQATAVASRRFPGQHLLRACLSRGEGRWPSGYCWRPPCCCCWRSRRRRPSPGEVAGVDGARLRSGGTKWRKTRRRILPGGEREKVFSRDESCLQVLRERFVNCT